MDKISFYGKSIGQAEIVVGAVFLLLISGMVIAQNVTNITNFTGGFLANLSDPSVENVPEIIESEFTAEATRTFEVWANSAIALPLTKNMFHDNETLELKVSILLDNGTSLPGAEISFYLDDVLIGSDYTNPFGEACLTRSLENLSGEYMLSAVFSGGDFINPSREEVLIHVIGTSLSIKKELHLKEKLGHLEITVFNISEGSYKTFDLDENYERIEQKYYKAYVKVFNNFSRVPGIYDLEDNEVIEVSLEDGLGNYYEQDNEILFFLKPLNLFGDSAEIPPSSGREGYLIFSETVGVPEKLVFRIKSRATAEFGLR